MDKSTKKQVLNKTDKEPQVNRKILDPNRDINKLLENQVNPSTIKILMGQFNKNSSEYKKLEKEYRNFLLQKNTRPGVIRSDDYKKNNEWEQKKAKSYFISTSYRVEKKTPLDIMNEKKKRKNKDDIYGLGYDSYKEIYEEHPEDLNLEQQQDQSDKQFKTKIKEKKYRATSEEMNEILKSNQPIFTQQINELKKYGLSVVDFAVESDEKINIIKEDELTIELIKNPVDDDQIDRTKFVSNEKKPIEKPVTVKLVRKTIKSSIAPVISLNSKDIIHKKPAIMNELNSNQRLNSMIQKPIINRSFANPGFVNSPSKVSQIQSKQEDLSDIAVIDEIKQPKFVQEIAAKKRLEKYANGLKGQQDNINNPNNVSLRKEIGELNRLVNQEKQIRFNKTSSQTEDIQEESSVSPISSIENQTNFNNIEKEKDNEKIFTFEKQPKFVQEIETKKQLEKSNNNLNENQTNKSNFSLKDEIKQLNDLVQQEGKISSTNQMLDDQIQQQRKISDTLFERYNQLTEKEEEIELHLLKKLKSNDNNVIGEYILDQNEEYQLLLKLKKAIEHNEKSLVDSLKRQVELSQLIKLKHSQ